jgi:hypothetical protein
VKLYTIIFEQSGRSSVAQVRAQSPHGAFKVWSDNITMRQALGDPFPDGLAVAEELEQQERLVNVWRSAASEGGQLGMVFVVQTDEPVA